MAAKLLFSVESLVSAVLEHLIRPITWFTPIAVLICVFLVLFGGLMSGLTLGLLSFDEFDLQLLIASGSSSQRKSAMRIMPLIKREHYLLITLLLFNALAMEALPIFLDMIVSSWLAVLISVTAVLIFGEILPQSICTRYGLTIGSFAAPVVTILMFLALPVALPLSLILNKLLGKAHSGYYRKSEIKDLVMLHTARTILTVDESLMIKGVLELREKTVGDILTPWKNAFTIDGDRRLDRSCVKELIRDAHSRIPVYSENPLQLEGILMVKKLVPFFSDLVFNNDDDDDQEEIVVETNGPTSADSSQNENGKDMDKNMDMDNLRVKVKDLPLGRLLTVSPTMTLDMLLHTMNARRLHLAVVVAQDNECQVSEGAVALKREPIGLVTLEDVIEALILLPIEDESDRVREGARSYQRATDALPADPMKPLLTLAAVSSGQGLALQVAEYPGQSSAASLNAGREVTREMEGRDREALLP
jgi:CBS domain containing-hemolysin-like protein